jgi:prophage antirepressor-like protein
MKDKRMSNPKNFCEEAMKLDIRYEYLIEAKMCIGGQKLAQMFIGKSLRGGGDSLSSATIESWINTFIFVQNNPDEKDKDQYSARRIEPRDSWYKYLEIIKKPIDDDVVKMWKNLSAKKLGDQAEKYGITLGIRNAKAVGNLQQRMLDMVERRKNNIWNKLVEEVEVIDGSIDDKINYKFKNVPELRRICKERNLQNAHITDKEGLIELLEKNPFNAVYNLDINNIYTMTHPELKSLAKERGFNEYNNVSKTDLLQMHEEYDLELKKIGEQKEKENENVLDTFEFDDKIIRIIRHNNEPWFVAKDICDILEINNNRKTISGIPEKWKGVTKSDTLGGVQEMTIINEPAVYKIIMRSNKPNAQKFQDKVCEEILPSIRKKGYYKLEEREKFLLEDNRPTIKRILDLSEFDIEAELLEIDYDWTKWTNKCVLYVVYIGEGLIKLGFSDHKLDKREIKHQGSESNFKQYRMVKVLEISGKIAEDKMKDLLNIYRVKFHNQHEIFKPPSTITNFIENIENLLRDNDLHMIISKQQQEIAELKLIVCEMEKKNLELQLQLK